jgi:hypothetical protein
VFNPWDRALKLSVKHERPFLRMENLKNPMAGRCFSNHLPKGGEHRLIFSTGRYIRSPFAENDR